MNATQLSTWPDWIFNEGYDVRSAGSYVSRAQGCTIADLEGRTCIDLAMGGGACILGHANPAILAAVREQLDKGSIFTAPNAAVHEMGERLAEAMPWFGGFVFCNSGSEATMRLIRIARAVTGRRKIGVFSGGWHGSHDMVLVEEDYGGCASRPAVRCKSAGTPEETLNSVVFLPYQDEAAFDLIRENRDELAVVLIEPVQGSNPRDDIGGFLSGLRRVTEECGVLLAFDEVITGFRLAYGGGQEWFGLHGDLAAYGKAVGGGLPVGMVAGTRRIMESVRRKAVFMGGTFSANPLTIAAGLATLRYLGDNLRIYSQLAKMGRSLRSAINRFCTENGLPARMIGVGSISRLVLTGEPIRSRRERDLKEPDMAAQRSFYDMVRRRGVHIGVNRLQFLSTAHGDAEVENITVALCDSLREFWAGRRS